MTFPVRIPSVGESIAEVTLARWLKGDGELVAMDEPICEIDSDKTTLELPAERAGRLRRITPEGATIKVGAVIGEIDESATAAGAKGSPAPAQAPEPKPAGARAQEPKPASGPASKPALPARPAPANAASDASPGRPVRREKMSRLRRTIADRLVAAKNETALLTTFNEVDMSAVMEIRASHKDVFAEKHGVKLGFLSFFVKFAAEALREWPAVNAMIDGDEIVHHDYADIGIAVSTEKGLVVPVLRDAGRLSMAEIERGVGELARRARDGELKIDDFQGGTFTITNGGVFGSLLSTPIINIPQCAILGMHAIQDRPVARDGKVVIRPMMYLALSYDHRIIDGREAVGFLVKMKGLLEDPARFMLGL